MNSSINERINLTQGLIEKAILRKVQASSKSPMRQSVESTLENIPDNLINKSAIVEGTRQLRAKEQLNASNISGMSLPSKLQKMKEKVQRDRSQNSINDENRDGSLYGRKKIASIIDEETQKLRESYNQHKKKSKDRSVSGLRSSVGALSNNGGNILNKQNFKEDPYDNEFKEKSNLSLKRDNNMYKSSQSIAMQLRQQNEIQKSQMNKFKRSTGSSMTLANYQIKYQKLEQNYRKFTSNLINPNQSQEIINDLKLKTGITFMLKFLNKQDALDLRNAIKFWRINSGLAIKQFNNQGKTLMLVKAVQKMSMRSSNYCKIQCYQKWKMIAFKEQGANPRDRMVSILSELITSSIDFNRCVENDFYLSQILSEKLFQIMDITSSDLLLFDGEDQLKTYHLQSGEQINFSFQSLLSNSILGEIVFDVRQDDQIIKIIQMLQKNTLFNKDVDLPINKEKIIEYNQNEPNVFNKVRHLSMAMIKIQHPSRIGILRLFFSCPQGGNSPTSMQLLAVNHLAKVLPMFLQRIFDVRSQINTLAINNIDQNKQIERLEFYNQINRTLNDYQEQLQQNENEIQQTQVNLMNFTSHTVETFFKNFFEMENVVLKQIFNSQKKEFGQPQSLVVDNSSELVRMTNHAQDNNEVIEDFLDHRKEYYIHQISIQPLKQGSTEFEDFTFIFHIQNNYEAVVDRDASMVNLSTSLTSNVMSFSALRSAAPYRKYLDEDMKFKLCYFLRYLSPIVKSAISVATEYAPSIKRLSQSLMSAQLKYNLQITLQKQVTENNVIEEKSPFNFFIKIKNILSFAISQILPEPINNDQHIDLYLNRALFNGNQINNFSHLVFQSFMDEAQVEQFYQNVVLVHKLDEKRQQKYTITQFDNLQEVSLSLDVFDVQISKFSTKTGDIFVQIPLIDQSRYQTMAVITFCTQNESQLGMLQAVEQELTTFLLDFIGKRMAFQQIQVQHDLLLNKLQGEKISQETKDLIEQNLIIPFLKKQSLKTLGDSIDYLADKLITHDADQEEGQEISQIAFISPNTYIEDIRLQSTYSQVGLDFTQLDKMLLQSYQLKQQIVYEDDVLEKVVILYPFMSQLSYKSALAKQNAAIILRFVIDRDNMIEKKVQNIHNQLINVVSPVMDAIMLHDIVSVKQSYGIEKLVKVIEKYKFANYREIIYFMRDLKAKNVYNFSRSRLYTKLAKSKNIFELKNQQEDELFDAEDKHLNQNQIIQAHIRKAVTTMNKFAFSYKHSCFKKFVIGTRMPLYANMSKKKKKAVCTLANYYSLSVNRELFLRFAINTKCYKYINHPKTKYLGSVSCLFRNFRVVRERLAFMKMKKNLNMLLRDSMNSFRENDKDLFIQLNQILISSQNQQGGLEGGFSYSLSEIFSYIKNIMDQDMYIKDVGLMANDTYVGHVDEAILTIKSGVYLPSNSNQKLKIFICDLTDQDEEQIQFQKRQPLRLSYDDSMTLNQEDHLFGQINSQNLERIDQIDIVPSNDFENQLQQSFSKYTISLRKDLIHQMLDKSNGITFNFQNVQQSMSDIFLGQQSNYKDHNIGNRYTVVRRSKSALIIPLFDVSQSQVIGSLELYKHHQQTFTEEIEQRYEHFAKLVGDFFLLYGQLSSSTLQINQLKWQIQKAIKPVNSLSLLLKSIYVNGPGTHFTNASHVLPIILMNQELQINQDEVPNILSGLEIQNNKIIFSQKLAFFYQFKDNHIYSFEYEGTFIEEIVDNGCILEMCKRGALDRDEDIEGLSKQSSIENIGNESGFNNSNVMEDDSQRFGGQRHRTLPASLEQIKTITGEHFKHIIYYPIFDVQDETNIIALFEVAFKKKQGEQQILLDDNIQQYLDQFRSHLQQFRVRLNSFTRNIENIFAKRQQRSVVSMFQTWKQMMIFMQYKEQFQVNQFQALQNQEMCYSEYVTNLESCNQQIKHANDDKANMQSQLNQYSIEKKAKLKFLATSLISSNNLFKRISKQKVKEAFLKWQYNVSVRKIAETAFNRVLELNHRHSKARIKTGVFLLQNIVEGYTLQTSFNDILQAAHLRRFEGHLSDVSPVCKRSRSKSRGYHTKGVSDTSFALNNISSLLSPRNLKKIEKINLYKQQINSLYNPIMAENNNKQRLNSTDGLNSSQKKINHELPVRLKYSKTKSTYAFQGLLNRSALIPTSQKAPYRKNNL